MPLPIDIAHAFDVVVTLDPPQEFGEIATGNRRIININGGTVTGPKLCGNVLPGGADWQLVKRDGSAHLDARYTLQADDGGLIYVQNQGFRHGPADVLAAIAAGQDVDPSTYYMRTLATMESAAPAHDWVNRAVFVCTGARLKSSVEISFYEVI